MILEIERIVAGVALLVLPGAWIGFGFPLPTLTFPIRLAVATVLSPVVLLLQFYPLRWAGLPFGTVAWVLVALNAGSLLLIVRHRKGRIPARELLAAACIFVVLAVCVALPWFTHDKVRVYTGHTFMHMGIIYQVSEGALALEDPEMAGVRLAYPGLPHAYWAIQSWALDWSPTRTYVLLNLVSLAAAGLLFHGMCQFLGAGSRASRIAFLWLGLGTNGLGALVWWLMLQAGRTPYLIGDARATTWIRKFTTMQITVLAVCLFGVVVLSGLWARRTRRWDWFAVHLLAVAALGFIYPILFPLALVVSGMLLVAMWIDNRRGLLLPVAGLVGVMLVSALFLSYVATDRAGSLVSLATSRMMLARTLSNPIALAPFLVALWLVRKRLADSGMLPLIAAAGVNVLMAIVLRVGGDDHQYKFLFCTALLLAPAVALAVEHRFPSRAAQWALTLAAVLLLVPVARFSMQRAAVGNYPTLPDVNEASFAIALAPGENDAPWIRALAEETPANTVILANDSKLSLPALVHRSLWVAADHGGPGHWLGGRWNMVEVRGYRAELFETRKQLLKRILAADGPPFDGSELDPVRQLDQPIALVFGPGEGTAFQAYLEAQAARKLYSEPRGHTVWLLPARSPSSTR